MGFTSEISPALEPVLPGLVGSAWEGKGGGGEQTVKPPYLTLQGPRLPESGGTLDNIREEMEAPSR